MGKNKGMMIAGIEDGRAVEGVFLVKEMNRGETRAGKPFLRLTLMDKSGEIGGPVWDDAEALAPICQSGLFVRINGQGENYRGAIQLRINRVSAVAESEIDLADFMPSGDFDRRQLEEELAALIASIRNPHLNRLLTAIFQDDQRFRQQFTTAPAAKTMHHAYLGGLLEHTVAVTRLAAAVCRLYPAIDRDLLLAGALLHDLGKTEELTYAGYPFGYSDRGRLVGHLVIGAETIREKAAAIPGFPPELMACLQHLVLSHHGRHEFGAPTLPMMQEAFILHFLDDLDAKVNYFARLSGRAEEPGYQWSEYQRNLERFLYLRGAAESESPPPSPAGSNDYGPDPADPAGDRPSLPPQPRRKSRPAQTPAPPDQGPDSPPDPADQQTSDARQKSLWG
ncbi:HD domain-containing protein [Desulfurivibrio sp. C05AmB]|jgi:3'-5' exoribonuclease|uniref:3'-5' exoribonuclease YhaM family protein n=1 Tax=Desulfurivibrio sp. C05AmB TaxID=3374371 RepID=UPI00376EC247